MSEQNGKQLAQLLNSRMQEIRMLCEGLSEETASKSPAGRWSPKEIISHLIGPEGGSFLPLLRLALVQEAPRLDIEAENPFFTNSRAAMSMKELLSLCEKEYRDIADFLEGLSDDQLKRELYVPLFKDLPLTDHPSLAVFISGVGGYHMEFHINHMKEILKELGAPDASV
ncbi:MAG: DinB family protein [Nitrospirae bacterium]|nr:DinB family protein [Nitrospirota bacterium]